MSCPHCGAEQRPGVIRVRRPIVAILFALGLLLAYALGGQLLHDLAEGMDRSRLDLWKLVLPVATLGLALVAAFARRKQPVCEHCPPRGVWEALPADTSARILSSEGASRRVALRTLGATGATVAAAAGGLAAAVLPNRQAGSRSGATSSAPMSSSPRRRRATSGRAPASATTAASAAPTPWSPTSRSAPGGSAPRDWRPTARAPSTWRAPPSSAASTYFDTAPDYSDTVSEHVLGEAMKGQRDKMFLATKFCVADGHLPNDTPVPKIIEAVEGSLQRLQTDHVDLIHIHSCDRVERLMAPNIHEAFDRLKEQGKVRFLGVSTHTPNLEEVANAAIDSGRFDVMMLAYHFGMWPSFGHILEKAKAHDVGIVAMKTLKGAKHTNLADFRAGAGAYSQSAFRWVLSNPAVSCLVISISTLRPIDEYLYASGTAVRSTDVARARSVRPAHRRRLLPAALRRLPGRRVPTSCRSTTSCAIACTSRLRLGEGRHAPVRQARPQSAMLCASVQRAVHAALSDRRADSREDDGRARPAQFPGLSDTSRHRQVTRRGGERRAVSLCTAPGNAFSVLRPVARRVRSARYPWGERACGRGRRRAPRCARRRAAGRLGGRAQR